MIAYYVKDKDIMFTSLGKGMWLVDGKPFENDTHVEKKVEFKSTIQKITVNMIPLKWIGEKEEYTREEYETIKQRLTSRMDEDGDWLSLEDEFAYRKFVGAYTPIYQTVETVSEPLTFAIEERIVESGVPFVNSLFSNGDDKSSLFVYDRPLAWMTITRECFDSLGMQYLMGLSYGQTTNKKVWSNSEHSIIEYVVAFGSYIFTKEFTKERCLRKRGSVEDMAALYKADKKRIEEIITDRYKEHFGKADIGTVDFQNIAKELRTALGILHALDVKTKSISSKRGLVEKINEIQSIVSKYFHV